MMGRLIAFMAAFSGGRWLQHCIDVGMNDIDWLVLKATVICFALATVCHWLDQRSRKAAK